MTGDTSVNGSWFCKTPKHAGWWDYMFKIAMNGQFGISSRLDRWSDPLKQTAKQNIQLYKKVRDVIKGADVYHLTGMPDHSRPIGTMALQYQHNKKNVLTAYRFEEGKTTENFQLKNLVASRNYAIAVNGENKGTLSGKSLMTKGVAVSFPDEFSAALLEINEAD
jgi:alpha-galactosidase